MPLQALAVDIMYFYASLSEATLRVLALLCLSPIYSTALATRALGVLQRAAAETRVAPEGFLSLLLSLLTGRSSQVGPKQVDGSFERSRDVIDAACQAVQQFPGGVGTCPFKSSALCPQAFHEAALLLMIACACSNICHEELAVCLLGFVVC